MTALLAQAYTMMVLSFACMRVIFVSGSCQSTRGQAREYGTRPSLESVRGSYFLSAAVDSLQIHQMARTKNVGGGPEDEDPRHPPRLPADPKGKVTKKVASKKRKYPDVEIARAAIVAEAAERAERGGTRSGVIIANQHLPPATRDEQLPPATRDALEEVERRHGALVGTVMVVG